MIRKYWKTTLAITLPLALEQSSAVAQPANNRRKR